MIQHFIDSGHELIRIGANTDEGYLVPDILDQVEYCFSPFFSSRKKNVKNKIKNSNLQFCIEKFFLFFKIDINLKKFNFCRDKSKIRILSI